ncbi:hypothetical protein [Actinomadura sp. 9N215]|uniref:hypothetical protein n=1 Tax=Actinomadura sp. 9N215 TaxID=3375150 RepID=UPI003797720A
MARAAGVSLGSLTYHFPSPADLLREALQTVVENEIARRTPHMKTRAGPPPPAAPVQDGLGALGLVLDGLPDQLVV